MDDIAFDSDGGDDYIYEMPMTGPAFGLWGRPGLAPARACFVSMRYDRISHFQICSQPGPDNKIA
jgi:hypothetical protein